VPAGALPAARLSASDEKTATGIDVAPSTTRDDRQLLEKHAVEKMTSLDITTIYRKMAAGTFPQPVKVGRRRVASRVSDITQWRQALEVRTETARWRAATLRHEDPNAGGKGRQGRR
jgi:prophage regulatory protein